MFHGTYYASVDNKRRAHVPQEFQAELKGDFYAYQEDGVIIVTAKDSRGSFEPEKLKTLYAVSADNQKRLMIPEMLFICILKRSRRIAWEGCKDYLRLRTLTEDEQS